MSIQMTDRIKSVLDDLSNVSFAAKVIADRIHENLKATSADGEVDPKDMLIASLKKQLADMTSMVALLKAEINEPEEMEFDDIQADNFSKGLASTLKDLNPAVIKNCYGRSFLLPYPRNVRVLICTVLLNHFKEAKITPLNIWYEIIASNGSLT